MARRFSRVMALIENLPLRPTIALALLLGLALPIMVSVWRDFAQRRTSLLEHLASDHQRLCEVLAIGMTTPIWEVRPDTGRPLIEAVMRDERVVGITVSAPRLANFLSAAAPERRRGEILGVERPVFRGEEEIGRVRLEMSTAPLDAELARQGRQVLLTGAVQLAFGLLLLFPLLRFKVLVPLRRLAESSRAVAAGDLQPLAHDWSRGDELGVLGRTFEEMRQSLRRLIGDLETSNQHLRQRETELSQQSGVLRATLDNMTDGITLVDGDLRLKAWNDRFLEILDLPADIVGGNMPIAELHTYDLARGKYAGAEAETFLQRMREGFIPGKAWRTQLERADGRIVSIRRRPLAASGFVTTYTDVTEQVTAQRAADRALQLLEAVMDAVPAILHVKDRDLRYRMVNRYFLNLWDFQREAVIGRRVDEIFSAQWLAEFTDWAPQVLSTGRSAPFYEWNAGLPDGERIDLLGTKVPLLDDDGRVTHVVTVEIDITQRKQAERALRESEELHRLLVDLSPFGIMLHDRVRIRFLNPAGCRILDLPGIEPVLGMHFIDFVAETEKMAVLERIRRLFETGEQLEQSERNLVTIDGAVIEVSITAVPVNRGGEVLALVVFQDIGERKRAERALRESERFYRGLIDNSPYGILLHDDDRIVFLNSAGRGILGIPAEETVGDHYRAFVHPDERDQAMLRLQRVLDGETVPPTERRLQGRGGREIDVAIAGVPLTRNGKRLAFVMFGDITRRKRTELERQRWLQLFQDAIASIPNGFAVFDPARRLVICNTAFAELYAAVPDDLAGATAIDLLDRFARLAATVENQPADYVAADLDALLERLWYSEGSPIKVEMHDGRWMLVAHHRTVEGGLVIVRTDITDLKRMQQALRDSEELYRLLVDLSPYGILLHDRDAVVFMNEAGCRLLGATDPAQTVGHHYGEFVAADERDAALARLRRVLEDGDTIGERERRLLTLDGREITVVTSAVPFRRGGQRQALVFFVDISERKRAEAEIARQREALHQAEKMSALGSLLAGVAHELNNPLSVVVGRAIMLQETSLDPVTAASVGKIRAAAERCARIVKSFLAMARQQAPARRPVQIDGLIEEALDLLGYGLRGGGIAVVKDIAANLPPVMGDPDQLAQVFNNLIINAKQAMAETSSLRLLRIVARFEPEMAQVHVIIADTGPGIPAEIRPRIFDPYFTTKEAGFGTGIGLAVCRGIVEAHGGSITLDPAEAADGGGATFHVYLPVMQAGADVHAPAVDAGSVVVSTAVEQHTVRRALVVDDEADIVAILADILGSEGYQVLTAASGRSALQVLQQQPVDLVVSDLLMPDGDGRDLYKAIRTRFPALLDRLVFVTGDTLGTPARRFLARVKRPVIEKPFSPQDIRRAIAHALATAPVSPAPAVKHRGPPRRDDR